MVPSGLSQEGSFTSRSTESCADKKRGKSKKGIKKMEEVRKRQCSLPPQEVSKDWFIFTVFVVFRKRNDRFSSFFNYAQANSCFPLLNFLKGNHPHPANEK